MGGNLLAPNGITAILFDLDGTLRFSRPSYFQAFFDFARQAGAGDLEENRQAAIRWLHYYWAQSDEMLADREKFAEQEELFWNNHARRELIAFGCPETKAEALAPEVNRLFAENYEPEDWVPAEVIETLRALKEAGFSLGVLSNRTHPFREHMEGWGLEPYFDLALAAGEVNWYKPDPEIFLHAVRKMGKQPDETLYVGDNYYADVIGAQRAGLPAVLLDAEDIFPEAECTVISGIGQLTVHLAE